MEHKSEIIKLYEKGKLGQFPLGTLRVKAALMLIRDYAVIRLCSLGKRKQRHGLFCRFPSRRRRPVFGRGQSRRQIQSLSAAFSARRQKRARVCFGKSRLE